MKRARRVITLAAVALFVTGCTSNGAAPHDPGKVVLPGKQVAVPGKLYATKGRSLYRFSGTHVTPLLAGMKVKDPAVSADGARLAFAQLEEQRSSIVLSDRDGKSRQAITPLSGPEGPLWAFAPSFSADTQQVVYLTDRGKQASSPVPALRASAGFSCFSRSNCPGSSRLINCNSPRRNRSRS